MLHVGAIIKIKRNHFNAELISWLIDNTYVTVGNKIFSQNGDPNGADCASRTSFLSLYPVYVAVRASVTLPDLVVIYNIDCINSKTLEA